MYFCRLLDLYLNLKSRVLNVERCCMVIIWLNIFEKSIYTNPHINAAFVAKKWAEILIFDVTWLLFMASPTILIVLFVANIFRLRDNFRVISECITFSEFLEEKFSNTIHERQNIVLDYQLICIKNSSLSVRTMVPICYLYCLWESC